MATTTNGAASGSQSAPAGALTAAIRALRGQVPGFIILTPQQAKAFATKWTYDPKFIEATASAYAESPKLQAACSFDVNGSRDAIRFDAAFLACEQEASVLSSGIRGAREQTYAGTIDSCDHVLAVAQGILKQPVASQSAADKAELAALAKFVKAMQTARKMRRKTATVPKPKTTPKKAARAAKRATATAAKATTRAQKAAARAEAAAAKAAGGVATTNGAAAAKSKSTDATA